MVFTSRIRSHDRRGALTVEFALTTPLLFMLFLGAIEFTRANMLLHTISMAATEAARDAIVAGATADEAEAVARAELSAVGIAEADIAIEPAIITAETDIVAVGVSVPLNSKNGYLTPRFYLGKRITRGASMNREAKPSDKDAAKGKEALDKAMDIAKKGKGN